MTLALPERFVLFDTEYTAWEGSQEREWSGAGEYKEIIQIGAITVAGETLAEESAWSCLVRPVKNPELSAYIRELTGIEQAALDAEGVPLAEALAGFAAYLGSLPAYSYGNDVTVIRDNCALIGVACPVASEQCSDIRPLLAPALEAAGVDPSPYTSGTLIQALGTPPPARAHDAVNDMRNLLAVLRALRARE